MDIASNESVLAVKICCPICKAPAVRVAERCQGYKEGLVYNIFLCNFCDLQFVDPMDVPNGLYEAIYNSVDNLPHYHRYSRYRFEVLSKPNPIGWLAEREPAFWFINSELTKLPRNSRILEVGSGLGYLTYALKKAGYNIRGIDISAKAVEEARSRFGDFYLHEDLAVLASNEPAGFDAIIMTEVLEHVPYPTEFLRFLVTLLKPGGTALVTTPNKSSFPLNALWRTENPPVHLWWFSETVMRRFAQEVGFSIRFCDFSKMHRNGASTETQSELFQEPAWLTQIGDVTDAGQRYVASVRRSENTIGKFKAFIKQNFPALGALLKLRKGYDVIAQRNYTMGVVFSKTI